MLNTRKSYNILFVICTYSLFWISIMLMGGTIFIFGEKAPMDALMTFSSWTPTIVLMVLFKKLVPNTARKDFFKKLFSPHINGWMLLTVTVIQLLVFILGTCIVSFQKEISVLSLLNLSLPMVLYSLFISLIQGATGEESCWRGYLFPVMAKKSGVIKGSILLGLIWVFWHTPLWFLSSGYTGLDLVTYITAFLVTVVSTSVIIGICYNYNRNLIVPMWIHLMMNFSLSLYGGNLLNLLIYLSPLYALTAFGFCLWHKKISQKFNNDVISERMSE
ncbi:CPBP family intramembrane metalloprotease [Clostridium algoriphilum]|uniref:CPBP family intramembrane glutamic endopeptidase n=1 Tax=Clostridium algoriphilum TaxID=198347 RepID=UPI001CF58F82|nr:type II CAAX endopeptidase family protein [Clostridium algoriphilum]MCB2294224.1 CPBP family intramembrane metalloprotease [Clostridium algoriphilum]